MSDANKPINSVVMVCLVAYLGVATVLSGNLVYSLWSAPVKVTPPESAKTPADMCKVTEVNKDPKGLTRLMPNAAAVGSAVDVQLLGCGFTKDTVVQFNGAKHAILYVNSGQITLPLTGKDIATTESYALTLYAKDGDAAAFGTGQVWVDMPIAQWKWLCFSGAINQESLLLLLVAFMGAFGSSVYALKSLADYRGDGKLTETWGTFYLVQPFEGAGIAVLMYLVVRGGFTGAGGGDIKSVNQFGVCAIAGLSGAFSDIAFKKLLEVFQTLFKPQDDRGGKIGKLSISTSNLPAATKGFLYDPVTLKAVGGTGVLSWSVVPPLPAGLALDPATGMISGTPTVVSPTTDYTFTVIDSSNPPVTASQVLKLAVSLINIDTVDLPAGTDQMVYASVTLKAKGGTLPLTWSVSPLLPAGLALDPATGVISGTPTAKAKAADYTFTVDDSSVPPITATKVLNFEVK